MATDCRETKMNLVSDLPQDILHHILSFLPDIDLLRAPFVSKMLASSLLSFPIVVLDQRLTETDSNREKADAFLNSALNWLRNRREPSTKIQRFRLRVKVFAQQDARIRGLTHFAFSNCVGEVDLEVSLFRSVYGYYPLPYPRNTLKSFTILKLRGYKLDADHLVLISSCPLLEDLTVHECRLPAEVRISSGKLKRLDLAPCFEYERRFKVCKIEIDALNLCTLALKLYSLSCECNFSSCKSLRELSLGKVIVTSNWARDHLCDLPHIEILKIVGCCQSFEVNISSSSLKILEVVGLYFENVIVDAPKLESLICRDSKARGLDITPCRNLKSLELKNTCLEDKWVQDHICNLPNLEILKIHGRFVYFGVDISSSSLKLLELVSLPFENATIRAPKLESLICIDSKACSLNVSPCQNLKSLELEYAHLEDKWLQYQICNLPAIQILRLMQCTGLLHINISSSSLKTLVLFGRPSIKFLTINTRELEVLILKDCSTAQSIRITNCRGLKSLELDNTSITYHWIQITLSKLVSLQELKLVNCSQLKSFKIALQPLRSLMLFDCSHLKGIELSLLKLESLYLHGCSELEAAYINAPQLCSFNYKGKVIINRLNHSGSLHAKLSLDRCTCPTISWYCALRDFLQSFNRCEVLTLSYFEDLMFRGSMRNRLPPPLSGLKKLKIKELQRHSNYTSLVEDLLWVCPCPEVFILVTDRGQKSIEFKYHNIMLEEKNSFRSKALQSECWKHYLEKVTLENFYGKHSSVRNFFIINSKMLEAVVQKN